ncbi:hypothetical protein, partial [Brevibacillus massiliensis]|uniref:hypothetical protein n=1 Tax=Brevibacillus massiliensis TaxID=1118054 RepID=UPI001C54DDDA
LHRGARYYAASWNWIYDEYVGTVNQYSARSGWNTVGSVRLDNDKAIVNVSGEDWSGTSNTQTGADAVSL